MDFEEIKERYKLMPVWVRLLCASVPGVVLATYLYMDQASSLDSQLEAARTDEAAVHQKFENAKRVTASLPKQEEQLTFNESQLKKAKERLPDSFNVDRVLEKTAIAAKEMGVEISHFDPTEEKLAGESFRYKELPINLELKGHFAEIAGLLDRLVHFEALVHLRDLALEIDISEKVSGEGANEFRQQQTLSEKAREARQKARVKLSCKIVIFRSLAANEAADVPEPVNNGTKTAPGNGPKGSEPTGKPPAAADKKS